jgi:bisphosphoglycerate-dependent phosphoglycerate mutase
MRYVYKTCRSRALQYQIVPHQYPTQRMYGELTGLSKQMVKQRHGEAQFNSWRRGYNVKYVRLLASSGPHRNVFAHLKNLLAPHLKIGRLQFHPFRQTILETMYDTGIS